MRCFLLLLLLCPFATAGEWMVKEVALRVSYSDDLSITKNVVKGRATFKATNLESREYCTIRAQKGQMKALKRRRKAAARQAKKWGRGRQEVGRRMIQYLGEEFQEIATLRRQARGRKGVLVVTRSGHVNGVNVTIMFNTFEYDEADPMKYKLPRMSEDIFKSVRIGGPSPAEDAEAVPFRLPAPQWGDGE